MFTQAYAVQICGNIRSTHTCVNTVMYLMYSHMSKNEIERERLMYICLSNPEGLIAGVLELWLRIVYCNYVELLYAICSASLWNIYTEQIQILLSRERPILLLTCATCFGLPSNIRTLVKPDYPVLHKRIVADARILTQEQDYICFRIRTRDYIGSGSGPKIYRILICTRGCIGSGSRPEFIFVSGSRSCPKIVLDPDPDPKLYRIRIRIRTRYYIGSGSVPEVAADPDTDPRLYRIRIWTRDYIKSWSGSENTFFYRIQI